MQEIVKPKFLSNTPIGDDLFEGKSQNKIADVVASVIQDNNFQIIGIDGSWGTGKSNLVEIIKKKLSNHHFFIYDVWGHQEDEQRKAILVELTEYISCEKRNLITNKTKWKDKLKKLLAKEKEVTTINRPYLSAGFIYSLFSIIYIPTVNTFKSDLALFLGIHHLFSKFLLVTFPIFIVIAIYLYNLVRSWGKRSGFFVSFKIASQKTFQVYTNKQEEETKIETISENEPSVRDFRNWLKEIDIDLDQKKLILVFDNFDRLPKKHILSIWSSIHIFFSEEKYKNIKVIIPFDRLHIKNAFKELNSSDNSTDYANDYINKTFDLVYRVSQPILSDWKDFFKGKWQEAFGTVEEEEYLKVIQAYETFREKITPREIIACINEIVSIKLLDISIPDRYITIFVLNKDEILESPLKAISDPTFLQGLSHLYKEEEDFQKYITALTYQINPDSALEVVYKKQLKDSIINSKEELFKEISKTSVFDKIIDSVISELSSLDTLIVILDKLDEHAKISKVHLQSLWNNIYSRTVNTFADNFSILEYQKVLTKNIDIDKSKICISKIIEKLQKHSQFDPSEFPRMIDDFQNYLDKENIVINIFDILKTMPIKDVDAKHFIKFIQEQNDKYKNYRISTNQKKLDEFLSTQEYQKQNLDYLKAIADDYNLDDFEANIKSKITENNINPNKLEIFFNILKNISKNTLKIELSDIDISNLFNQIDHKENFYYDLICLRLSRLNNFDNYYDSAIDQSLNNNESNFAKEITQRIEFYMNFDDFLINGKHFPDSKLYKNVAYDLITLESTKHYYVFKDLLKNFDLICDNLDIQPDVLINKLDTLLDDTLKPEHIKEFPTSLFENIKKNDCHLKHQLFQLANTYYKNLNKEQWSNIFEDFETEEYARLKTIEFSDWNSYSLDALKTVLSNSIKDNTFSDIKEWEYLLNSFIKSGLSLDNTLKDLRDIFYNNTEYISIDLFKLLFKPFIDYSVLQDNPKEAFRTFIKADFLNDSKIIQLLTDNSEKVKEIMQALDNTSLADFKQAINDKINDDDDIKLLATKLGIKTNKKK